MKLYDSVGPNPQVVRIFIAEKGLDIPTQTVDLIGGENRRPPYSQSVNVAGQMPTLELDSGQTISEIMAICEYLEDVHPAPVLIGATPEQKAETRMWARRIDLNIFEPMANGFRAAEGRPLFQDRVKLVSAAGAADLKAVAADRLVWIDQLLCGGTWVCGDRFSLADIVLFAASAFGPSVGQPLPTGLTWLPGWLERMKARPSAAA